MGKIQPDLSAQRICESEQLIEGGKGIRFAIRTLLGEGTGFVVRYEGIVRGYVNQCRHLPSELDWIPGHFFDDSGLYLICATHGAMYDPVDGYCISGPCQGKQLFNIQVYEEEGQIYWLPTQTVCPISIS